MIRKEKWNVVLTTFFTIFFVLLLEAFFFRGVLAADKLFGDSGDGRLNNLLVEHWFKFFSGKEPLNDLLIYYPVSNTLSYSDMLLGFALPYSILRFFGVGMLIANKFSIIFIHAVGSFSLLYLLHNKLKLNTAISFIGVAICAYGNSVFIKSVHTQMFAFSLVPLLIVFIYSYFEKLNKNCRKRMIYAILSIILFELLLYTGFYIAWFFVLFTLILVITYCVLLIRRKINIFELIIKYTRKHVWELVFYIVLISLLVVPFLLMYIPTSRLFGSRSWSEVSSYLPRFIDFVNVSKYNLLYGKIFEKVAVQSLELCTGFPFITLSLFFFCFLFLWKHNKLKNGENQGISPNSNFRLKRSENEDTSKIINYQRLLIYALSVSVLISFLFLVRLDKVSLWFIIYKLIPGASALRAVSRYTLFLTLPVAIAISFTLQEAFRSFKWKQAKKLAIIVALCLFLVAENAVDSTYMSQWSITATQRFLDQVSSPPSECNIMYIIQNPAESNRTDYYNYQLEAWEIADHYGIKTLNGYSGQTPIGWEGLWGVNQETYLPAVNSWIKEYNLKNVYSYNIVTDKWKSHVD